MLAVFSTIWSINAERAGKLAPFALKRQVLSSLSFRFRRAAEGELAFSVRRRCIEVRDIGLRWFTSVENNPADCAPVADADVSFSADACDLLMIAAA